MNLPNATRPYCTFEVAGLRFGVDVRDVQEVIRHREPSPVPMAPPAVRGLINLRGQIVTLLDLRARLGLEPDPDADAARVLPMDVVVRAPGGPIGLIVDEVGDVLEVDDRRLDRVPETVPDAIRRLTTGLSTQDGRSILMLDIVGLAGGEIPDGR